MRWDNVIFGYLFVTYLIFITMRGELPVYAGFLLSNVSVPTPQASAAPIGAASGTGSSPGGAAGGSSPGTMKDLLSMTGKVAPYLMAM